MFTMITPREGTRSRSFVDRDANRQFDMDEHKFLQNLRSARKGVAPGPSGMTYEHFRPLLENPRDSHRFLLMVEQLAQGVAPEVAIHAMRVGRLTGSRKTDGDNGSADAVKLATSLATRAGCECVSHVLQGPGAMLQALRDVCGNLSHCRKMMKVLSMRLTEGGEQGDPLMPLLVLIGATRSVESRSAAVASWRAGFRLFG